MRRNRYPPTTVIPKPLPVVSLIAGALLGPGTLSGCRLLPRTTPAPAELAQARRLANEGLAAADRNELEQAERLLDSAVRSCPADVEARQHYAEVLWERGERLAAIDQIATAVRHSPGDAELCIVAAGMYVEIGLLDDARRLADEATRLAPGSAAAWHVHGQVALARGQDREALADYHRGLALDPDDRGLLLDTATVYRRLGRPQRVLATLAILGETYGADKVPADVLVLEGMAQESLGRTGDAIASYRRAVETGGAPQAAERLAALTAPAPAVVAASPPPGEARR